MTLFWRVFVINAGVLVFATLALALSPATVSPDLRLIEAVVLAVGVLVLIGLNVLLLRRVFAPLERLTALMRRVDPMAPGQRIPDGDASPEVRQLSRAFNDMLDRLERERRESGARALAAMEDERLRIARELHDEIGQTLTALVLQLETVTRQAPAELVEPLAEVRETARGSVEEVRRDRTWVAPGGAGRLRPAGRADHARLDVRRAHRLAGPLATGAAAPGA
jgi:two-component system sensor histidine kinase UhpB